MSEIFLKNNGVYGDLTTLHDSYNLKYDQRYRHICELHLSYSFIEFVRQVTVPHILMNQKKI